MNRYEYKTEVWSAGGKTVEGKILEHIPFVQWLNAHGAEGWHLSAMTEEPKIMSTTRFCVFARKL